MFINIYLRNPLKTWWKARKYFKIPRPSFSLCNIFCTNLYYYRCEGKVLDIQSHDVQWKDKYNSPRHEQNPVICICFFNRWVFKIEFCIYGQNEFGEKVARDLEYWEYLLNYIYYDKPLSCVDTWTYSSQIFKKITCYGEAEDGSEDIYTPYKMIIPIPCFSLNKKGSKQLKKEIDNANIKITRRY